MAATGCLRGSGRQRGQQRTDQSEQSIRQGTRFTELSRCALREGCELQWRPFAPYPAADNFDIYRNTIESVP